MGREGRSRSRDQGDEFAGEKPDRTKLYAIIAGAAAVILVVIVGAMSLGGRKDIVDTRTDAERNSIERQAIESEMQKDIDRATAHGRSKDDIDKIRKGYTDALSKIGK